MLQRLEESLLTEEAADDSASTLNQGGYQAWLPDFAAQEATDDTCTNDNKLEQAKKQIRRLSCFRTICSDSSPE